MPNAKKTWHSTNFQYGKPIAFSCRYNPSFNFPAKSKNKSPERTVLKEIPKSNQFFMLCFGKNTGKIEDTKFLEATQC